MERRPGGGVNLLSPREREILLLVAGGMSSRAVAARLGLSRRTVETHLARAREKLGASTRLQAIAIVAGSGEPQERLRYLDEQTLELLRLLAAGRTLREAADEVGVAQRTASRRLASVRRQLSVRTTAELLQRMGGDAH